MENIICNLCAGSPDCNLYDIVLPTGEEIKTDICIGKEIKYLIERGVKTRGCCCGHGEDSPNCLVDIKSESKIKELGYVYSNYTLNDSTATNLFKVKLKTNIQEELRIFLRNKEFGYKKI